MADDTIKRTMVIDYVQPSPRKWENPKGADLFFVSVNFADGTEGSVGVIEPKVTEAMTSLAALRGSPAEFELKAGKEYNGVQQWRLYDWPGKPSGLGGSGGGSRSGGGGMSHSQAGLLAAATLIGPRGLDIDVMVSETVRVAEVLTEYLFSRKPKETATTTETTAPTAAPEARTAADTLTLAQLKALKEAIEGAGLSVEDAQRSLGVTHLTQLTQAQADEAIELYRAS